MKRKLISIIAAILVMASMSVGMTGCGTDTAGGANTTQSGGSCCD